MPKCSLSLLSLTLKRKALFARQELRLTTTENSSPISGGNRLPAGASKRESGSSKIPASGGGRFGNEGVVAEMEEGEVVLS